MHDNDITRIAFNPAQSIVVESYLLVLVGIGNHQLNGITIPRAICSVFVVIICHDKPEINVVCIVGYLDG